MAEQAESKLTQEQVERRLKKRTPAWRAAYDFLMETKGPEIRYYDALLAVWMSATKKDRGDLAGWQEFADFIGVSRQVLYQWIKRRPEIKEWAKELTENRFDASTIAEVDAELCRRAKSRMGKTADIRLFYERAGVLKNDSRITLAGDEDEPVVVKRADELSDDELAVIAGRGSGRAAEKKESA